MHQRLARKGFDQATIDGVIARLVDSKLLDDEEFAEFWADQRSRIRPRGPIAVAAELRAKGVDPTTVRRALDTMPEPDVLAAEVAQRALKRFSHLDDVSYFRRMVAVLVRRGFTQSVAVRAARAAREVGSDHELAAPESG
jgi:regulatory protein